MEEAEVVLQQQRDQIKYNQNVKEALVKHRVSIDMHVSIIEDYDCKIWSVFFFFVFTIS